MNKKENLLKLLLASLFFLCLLDMPYGFYQFIRFLALIGFSILAYQSYGKGRQIKMIVYVLLALLFQPFFKLHLGRELWIVVDIIVGIGLICSMFRKKTAVERSKERIVTEPKEQLVKKPKDQSLYFSYMGGVGQVQCQDCNFEKGVMSFTHGAYECNIGRQCQSCGAFFTEHNVSKEYHKTAPTVEPLLCPECNSVCDVIKSRESALFCPQCKSKRLKYEIRYLT